MPIRFILTELLSMEQKKPKNPECNIQYSSAIILALKTNTKIYNMYYGYLMECQRSEIEISFFFISNEKEATTENEIPINMNDPNAPYGERMIRFFIVCLLEQLMRSKRS